LFGTFNITSMLAKVKPQYARYIELYGFPESSVFDPLKLRNALNTRTPPRIRGLAIISCSLSIKLIINMCMYFKIKYYPDQITLTR
jgi:hypothetical protein